VPGLGGDGWRRSGAVPFSLLRRAVREVAPPVAYLDGESVWPEPSKAGGPVRWNWRSRSRADLVEAVQGELSAARVEMEASLADAVAVIEGRIRKDLEQREKTTAELATRVDVTCNALNARELELLHALTRVADACETIALRVELDGQDRKALIGALEGLASSVTGNGQAALGPRRDRVTGGTIEAVRSPLDLTDDDIDAPSRPSRHA
jgi:hypothetical protein